MDTKAIIKDSRTFVPVRFVAEALGADVEWYGPKKLITIRTPDFTQESVVTDEVKMNELYNNYQNEVIEYITINEMIIDNGDRYEFTLKENNGTKAIMNHSLNYTGDMDLLKDGVKVDGPTRYFTPSTKLTYFVYTVDITTVDSFALYGHYQETMIIIPNPFKE